MTGINQGRPEMAIGEPIRLGSNNEFEIEQHPVSDRLIIRDTVNGKIAYVRKERGGQIGGDGVLVKALKEGKPVADDGRTHDTIQAAERAASGWVFVPPGTFNENVTINTEGLTLRGSGYNTLIDGGSGKAILADSENVTVRNLSGRTNTSDGDTVIEGTTNANNMFVINCTSKEAGFRGFDLEGDDTTITSCMAETGTGVHGIRFTGSRTIVSSNILKDIGFRSIRIIGTDSVVVNNICDNSSDRGFQISANDALIGGNRIINSGSDGIRLFSSNDVIVFNNRVSDSAASDISDGGTGTVLDANLTGASN